MSYACRALKAETKRTELETRTEKMEGEIKATNNETKFSFPLYAAQYATKYSSYRFYCSSDASRLSIFEFFTLFRTTKTLATISFRCGHAASGGEFFSVFIVAVF